ncbi:RipA family octameric membrane protein [Vibrio parahaemolyticus]|uniref:RipA family octameric membrane protein n=1 Tax=Vibrio parahaemolyticus TaxID=670 RepID=UPI00084AE310|nr:hypothetical protein [Vibrio parahaemolyticus]ODZ01741.1 hypothetical protein BBN00_23405 [Vibrio parahaemolyticus]ODZ05467.1 hypothetical protein BBM99_11670 [Vibrio parahaemolyticus]
MFRRKLSKIDRFEAYKIALDTRNLEIGLFWQRSNYFLLLNSALILGYFRGVSDKESLYATLLALLGLFVSHLWYRVNLGSKYWQARWEHRLKLVERNLDKELQFFNTTREITDNDVAESINPTSDKGWLHRVIESRALKYKPSVSYNMTLLSVTFSTVWFVLFMFSIPELKDMLVDFGINIVVLIMSALESVVHTLNS